MPDLLVRCPEQSGHDRRFVTLSIDGEAEDRSMLPV
jgi:hypothetical protein